MSARRSRDEPRDPRREIDAARAELRPEDPRLRHVLEHMRAMLVQSSADGRVLFVGASVAGLLGYMPEDLAGSSGWSWIHPEDRPGVAAAVQALRRGETSASARLRARHKSGHWIWLDAVSSSYLAADGSLHLLTFARDVSDQNAVDEALRASEARYDRLIENASDLIIELDSAGRVLFVSPNCERVLGRPAEQLVGRSLADFAASGVIHPDDRHALEHGLARAVASDRRTGAREARLLHGDGSWLWFDSRFSTYRSREGQWRALVIARDVTEARRARDELLASEERYHVIAEATQEIVSECDAEGRITYVSPAMEAVLGFRPSEIIGTTPATLIHPDDVERCVDAFLEGVAANKRSYTGLYRCLHRDGSWRWLDGEGIPFQRADGETRYLVISRDLTERVQAAAERRALDERAREGQRLESLGVMAGGIAHDFNNLLTPILGDASLALMDLPEGSPLRTRLERIQKAARRAAALTNQMLAYAGRGRLSVEPLDLSALVAEMAQLLESSAGRLARVELALADDLPAVEGDAGQLTQLVMNLLTNASEALIPTGGRIAIRTGTAPVDVASIGTRLGELPPTGPLVYLEVEDDGCGMDDTTRRRIFDPFFTTKFTGRGLGLAAALGIVRSHRGAIEIDSAPGEGTRFRVLFPASRARRPVAPPATAGGTWHTRGTALLVEEDSGVRALARDTLERVGFEVIEVGSGEAELDALGPRLGELRLAVLEAALPAGRCEVLLRRLREGRPELRIVLLGDAAQPGEPERPLADPHCARVRKPFLPAHLQDTIRRLLGNAADADSNRVPSPPPDTKA